MKSIYVLVVETWNFLHLISTVSVRDNWKLYAKVLELAIDTGTGGTCISRGGSCQEIYLTTIYTLACICYSIKLYFRWACTPLSRSWYRTVLYRADGDCMVDFWVLRSPWLLLWLDRKILFLRWVNRMFRFDSGSGLLSWIFEDLVDSGPFQFD